MKHSTKSAQRMKVGRALFRSIHKKEKSKLPSDNIKLIGMIGEEEALFEFKSSVGTLLYIVFHENDAMTHADTLDMYEGWYEELQ